MLANAAVGGQLGMSILGPPTAAVPAPVFSMKNSLQGPIPQASSQLYFGLVKYFSLSNADSQAPVSDAWQQLHLRYQMRQILAARTETVSGLYSR